MNGWIVHHGFPRVIHTDQGVQFESEIFKSMIAAIGAVKTRGSVYRPQTQGLVERQNQTIVTIVRTMSKRQEDWRQHLTAAMIAYNGSRHETTGRTPHSLMYLHENDPPIGLLFDDYYREDTTIDDYIKRNVCNLAKAHELCRNKSRLTQDRMARQHDKRVKNAPSRRVGEWVLAFVQAKRKHVRKLQRKYHGPFRIERVYNDGTHYRLDNGRKVHHEYLRPYDHRIQHLAVDETGEFMYSYNDAGDPCLQLDPDIWTDDRPEPDSDARKQYDPQGKLKKKRRKKRPDIDHEGGPFDPNNDIQMSQDSQEESHERPIYEPPAGFMRKQAETLNKNTLLPGEEFSDNDDSTIERAVIQPAPMSKPTTPDPEGQQRLTTLFDEAEEYDEEDASDHQPNLLEGTPAEEIEINHDPDIQPTYRPPADHEYVRHDHPTESRRARPPPQATVKRKLDLDSMLAQPPQPRAGLKSQATMTDSDVVTQEEIPQTITADPADPARMYDTEYMNDVDEMFRAHSAKPANKTLVDQHEATIPYGTASPRSNFSEGGEGPREEEAENAEFSRGIASQEDEKESPAQESTESTEGVDQECLNLPERPKES